MGDDECSVSRPVRELKAFAKKELNPVNRMCFSSTSVDEISHFMRLKRDHGFQSLDHLPLYVSELGVSMPLTRIIL